LIDWFFVFNATFSNISALSWRPVLVVEEAGVLHPERTTDHGQATGKLYHLLDYLSTHTSLSPIWHGFTPGFVNYKKGCTLLADTSDKVYQLLAHGRLFSLGGVLLLLPHSWLIFSTMGIQCDMILTIR
jgi:hypothetical protein